MIHCGVDAPAVTPIRWMPVIQAGSISSACYFNVFHRHPNAGAYFGQAAGIGAVAPADYQHKINLAGELDGRFLPLAGCATDSVEGAQFLAFYTQVSEEFQI